MWYAATLTLQTVTRHTHCKTADQMQFSGGLKSELMLAFLGSLKYHKRKAVAPLQRSFWYLQLHRAMPPPRTRKLATTDIYLQSNTASQRISLMYQDTLARQVTTIPHCPASAMALTSMDSVTESPKTSTILSMEGSYILALSTLLKVRIMAKLGSAGCLFPSGILQLQVSSVSLQILRRCPLALFQTLLLPLQDFSNGFCLLVIVLTMPFWRFRCGQFIY